MTADLTEVRDPAELVLNLVTAAWRSQALYAAVALRVPDRIAEGWRTDAQLAERTGADPDGIQRLMRLLTTIGVFAADEDGYRLTDLSHLLRSDVDGSMRELCLLYGEEFYRAWGCAVPAVRTGRSGFEAAFGRSLHQYLAEEPGAAARFQSAMAAGSSFFADIPVVFDFSGYRTVTDVAGGGGLLLATVLRAYPHLRGMLFDRPHVLPVAERELSEAVPAHRWEVVGGDFFQSVPAGSDVYLLSRVLQDWDDEACVTLLGNVRRAMVDEHSRLLILERVVEPHGPALLPMLFDLHLLMMAGGRERTMPGYQAILGQAGLELVATQDMALQTSLLIAAPA